MNLLNKLERKIGNYYIRNLMLIVILGTVLVYAFTVLSNNMLLINSLILDREKVLQGEVWRLITFIFVPTDNSIISFIFSMYFYYLAGSGLEQEWGEFKFNIYYFIGIITTIIISMSTGLQATGTYINLSLFLAFARIYPDFEILLLYILPIKIKYIAIFDCVVIAINFFSADSIAGKVLTLIPLINFFIFFGKDIIMGTKNGAVNYRRKQKFQEQIKEIEVFHRCEVCGITEKDNPKMEFRYCSKCTGKKCYCENHLRNHKHN
ncbi:MAG: rhomboid family intramembrane serine protease [Clostridium sp.]|nr:rhomboid family intramembrane serine protease [Clostridium sp.]